MAKRLSKAERERLEEQRDFWEWRATMALRRGNLKAHMEHGRKFHELQRLLGA